MNLKKIATNTKNKITETFNKLILEASKTPTQDEIKILERRSKKFNHSFFSYAVTGAIIVFFSQPLIKYANPILILLSGLLLSLTIIHLRILYISQTNSSWTKNKKTAYIILILSVCFLASTLTLLYQAYDNNITHKLYCKNIQQLIEKRIETEKNISIFSGMQCTPVYDYSLFGFNLL
ncbi:hypothetical protein RSL95_004684 [Escherichia coli]|nr:hypothetical protein [Escherichia coli]